MPYRDPAKRLAAARESKARRRAGLATRQSQRPPLPELRELRLDSARAALALLAHEVRLVAEIVAAGDPALVMNRARCIAYLVAVGLKAVELGDLTERLEELEKSAAASWGTHEKL